MKERKVIVGIMADLCPDATVECNITLVEGVDAFKKLPKLVQIYAFDAAELG